MAQVTGIRQAYANMSRGMAGARMPHMGGGGIPHVGGGGVQSSGRSGGRSNPMDAGFGSETETVPGTTFLGFPITEPHYTQRALEAQAAHKEFNSNLSDMLSRYMGAGGDPRTSMLNMLKDPQVMSMMVSHPESLKIILGMAQLAQMGNAQVVGTSLNAQGGPEQYIRGPDGMLYAEKISGASSPAQKERAPKIMPFTQTAEDGTKTTVYRAVDDYGRPIEPPNTGKIGYDSQGNITSPGPGGVTGDGTLTAGKAPSQKIGVPTREDYADQKGIMALTGALDAIKPVSGVATYGTGILNPLIAQMPFVGNSDTKAYEIQRGNLHSVINALATSGNARLKMVAEAMKALVPGAATSQDTVQNYDLPLLRDRTRELISSFMQDMRARNAPIDPAMSKLATTWGANPDYYDQITGLRNKMAQAPGSLTNQEIQLLNADNSQFNSMDGNGSMMVDRQRALRGLMDPKERAIQTQNNPQFSAAPQPAEDPHNYGTWVDYSQVKQQQQQQQQQQQKATTTAPASPVPDNQQTPAPKQAPAPSDASGGRLGENTQQQPNGGPQNLGGGMASGIPAPSAQPSSPQTQADQTDQQASLNQQLQQRQMALLQAAAPGTNPMGNVNDPNSATGQAPAALALNMQPPPQPDEA